MCSINTGKGGEDKQLKQVEKEKHTTDHLKPVPKISVLFSFAKQSIVKWDENTLF